MGVVLLTYTCIINLCNKASKIMWDRKDKRLISKIKYFNKRYWSNWIFDWKNETWPLQHVTQKNWFNCIINWKGYFLSIKLLKENTNIFVTWRWTNFPYVEQKIKKRKTPKKMDNMFFNKTKSFCILKYFEMKSKPKMGEILKWIYLIKSIYSQYKEALQLISEKIN